MTEQVCVLSLGESLSCQLTNVSLHRTYKEIFTAPYDYDLPTWDLQVGRRLEPTRSLSRRLGMIRPTLRARL